jgi:hypothetical protein
MRKSTSGSIFRAVTDRLLSVTVRDLLLLLVIAVGAVLYGAVLVGIPYIAVTEVGRPNGANEIIGLVWMLIVWVAFAVPALGFFLEWRKGLAVLKRWWRQETPVSPER